MAIGNHLPQRVDGWVKQALACDQTAGDKDKTPNSVNWKSTDVPCDQDRLTRVRGTFDGLGPVKMGFELDTKIDAFFTSKAAVDITREGDWQKVAFRLDHPADPQLFDIRANYRQNAKTGEVQDLDVREGGPTKMEMLKETVTDSTSLAIVAGAAGVGTLLGAVGGHAGIGAAVGGAVGAL
ncbi:unnamed protein product, partial [Phaeothamnion confervicola]